MNPARTFRVKVIANNLRWSSLDQKLEKVRQFYAPVCDLVFDVEYTNYSPTFNNTYPGLAPLYVVDRGWYDVNLATPYATEADIIMFIVAASDHPNMTTFAGLMGFNNVGPWETTIFAQGENDHVYMQGKDMGESFVHYACHELSHVFYYYCGKRDDTHVHFPVSQDPYTDAPENVLKDFDFSTQYAILEWLKDTLIAALTFLSILQKRHLA